MTINTTGEALDLNKLEALAKAATPQNFDSAQITNQGWIECPSCDGSGEVELTADYCNYDGRAIGVQFYGIGPEHRAAEAFYRAANPAAILELIALARAGSASPAGQQADGAGEVDAKDARITALRSALQEISEVRFGHEGDCGTTRIADDALYADEVAAQPKDTTDTQTEKN